MANTKQKQQKQLMVAIESFAVATKDGIPRIITPDTPLYDNDPIVKKYRANFEPLADRIERNAPVVHVATAAPGEQRSVELGVVASVGGESEPEVRSVCGSGAGGEECSCE